MKPAAAAVSRATKKPQNAPIKSKRAISLPDAVLKRKIGKHKEAIIGQSFKERRGLKTLLGEPKQELGKHQGKHKVVQRKLVTLPLLTRPKKELVAGPTRKAKQ